MMMRVLVLALTLLLTVTESRRAAKMSSIWDVILGVETKDKQEALSTNLVTTNLRQPEEKALRKQAENSSKTQRSKAPTVASKEGRRKMLINLMDVYHCPKTGVFPIDGDCERFLMCRSTEKTEKIKGKVYRCPKGYLFSSFGARCQPEASVACHRNNPLSRLLQRRLTHNRAKFFLMP